MTNEQQFTQLLGSLQGDEKAFLIEIPSTVSNPVRMLSRKVPDGAKVRIVGSKMFIKAKECKHKDAILLQV